MAGAGLLAASAAPLSWHYLGSYPQEHFQVDLEVYREGARALVTGFPLYDLRTTQPQFLPFTYPPFAAFTALPLLLAPFTVMGWIWTVVQFWLLWVTVGLAFRPFLSRFGARAPLAQGAVAASCVWMLPVAEGIRYGQVNAVVVTLCLWDVTRRRRTPGGRVWDGGSGIGVAFAAAVKLTPAVFWMHWAVARRWRVLAVSVASAALITVCTALVLPPASVAYWTDALLDPDRLGPNAGTSNQSLRGVVMRLSPVDGAAASVVWLVLVGAVLAGGFALSRRLDRLEQPVAIVAVVGLVAFLVSPVSWVHHMAWGVVVVGALLGDARERRRMAAALTVAALLWMRLPWWGANLLADPEVPRWAARLVQNSYPQLALLSLAALWWLVARAGRRDPGLDRLGVDDIDRPAAEQSPQGRQ